ncbi:MAG: NAD-dependent epimerase/dehydratase [Parcubacteria group bacterium GW2011_GWA2_42_11]|nr:MAG: NAD-dependent epimerase/dehydratase [Parcubacteria group bacterium GW2011_GWA2_42_11]
MKILITGGAGFIGSHLSEYLLNQGQQVICLDNFFTGSKKNVAHLLKNKNFQLVKHDVEKPYFFKVGQIYNLACPAAPIWYQKDPVKTARTNVLGAANALNLAKKLSCPVLQSSTSEIYGDPKEHPQKETYWGHVNPIGPRSCYDEGKRCAETLFFDYWREYGVDIKVVRIFNTYGPRMAVDDGRVVSNFIIQALKGEAITVYGSGNQTRSFCYADDMINALTKMMAAKKFTGPVNLGNPKEFTVKELAEKVIALTGSASKIIFKPLPQDDPQQRQPDISLAKEKLGWQPEINLEQGLIKTIEYFKEII